MRIGILGAGTVGQALQRRWSGAGHEITFGSRDPGAKDGLAAPAALVSDVVADHEVVVNATPGATSLAFVTGIGADAFAGKVLIDVANAITPGFELIYPSSTSLGEQLQAALPDAKIVKSMNTAAMTVITDPAALPASSVFVSGDDADAKRTTASLVRDLGWAGESIVDLGGIRTARATEHYFLMFAALVQSLGTPQFNIRVVR